MNRKLKWALCLLLIVSLFIPITAQAAGPKPTVSPTPEATICPEADPVPDIFFADRSGSYTITDAAGRMTEPDDSMALQAGDTVITSPAGYVKLALGEKAILCMDENTKLTLHRTASYIEVLVDEGSVLFFIAGTEDEGYSVSLRTPIAQVETDNAIGILRSSIRTELDHEGEARMGSVTNNAELDIFAGSADLTFWKTEALTPTSFDNVKKQKMTITAGEKAELQDVTLLDEPNEEDGGRAVRREQNSKISDLDAAAILNNEGFFTREITQNAQMQRGISAADVGISTADIKTISKSTAAIVAASEAKHKKEQAANNKLLTDEQATLSEMVKAASVYWYEVMYVFPLQKNEIVNPLPTPEPTLAPTPTPKPDSFTVELTYNGSIFGLQQVTENYTAGKPTLTPTDKGEWRLQGADEAFDFYKTPITGDITLVWIDKADMDK